MRLPEAAPGSGIIGAMSQSGVGANSMSGYSRDYAADPASLTNTAEQLENTSAAPPSPSAATAQIQAEVRDQVRAQLLIELKNLAARKSEVVSTSTPAVALTAQQPTSEPIPYTPDNGDAVQLRFNSGPIYPSGNVVVHDMLHRAVVSGAKYMAGDTPPPYTKAASAPERALNRSRVHRRDVAAKHTARRQSCCQVALLRPAHSRYPGDRQLTLPRCEVSTPDRFVRDDIAHCRSPVKDFEFTSVEVT